MVIALGRLGILIWEKYENLPARIVLLIQIIDEM